MQSLFPTTTTAESAFSFLWMEDVGHLLHGAGHARPRNHQRIVSEQVHAIRTDGRESGQDAPRVPLCGEPIRWHIRGAVELENHLRSARQEHLRGDLHALALDI